MIGFSDTTHPDAAILIMDGNTSLSICPLLSV